MPSITLQMTLGSGTREATCDTVVLSDHVAVILYTVAAALILIAAMTLVSSLFTTPRRASIEVRDDNKQWLVEARHEVIGRMSHFEQLLVAIGSVELGIVSYMAGVVISEGDGVRSPLTFYTIMSVLTFITTVAYLHTFKIYMAYSTYCVQLEIAGIGRGLRTTSEVFFLAQNAAVSRWIKPFISAAASIQAVALFPVFILMCALVGFGVHFCVDPRAYWSLVGILGSWAAIYIGPSFVEFMMLVNIGCKPGLD